MATTTPADARAARTTRADARAARCNGGRGLPGLRALLPGALLLGAALPWQVGPALGQPALPGTDPLGLGGPAARPLFEQPGGAAAEPFWQADPFGALPLPAGRGGGPWSLSPSLEVQGVATDNLRNAARDREADVYTRINPQLVLGLDSPEITGRLSWRPSLRFHANNPDQDRIDQVFGGQATATLVPDLLFVDLRGSGDVRSVFGGLGALDAGAEDGDDRVQSTTYQVSPYVVQRLGGIGTARIGYAFRQTIESGDDAFAPGQAQPFFTSQDFTSHQGFAVLRSGEEWGRFAFQAQASATRFEGSGIYDDARRDLYVVQTRYSLTREIAVLVDGGWQDDRYGGVTPLAIREPVWGVGLRLSPDPDSFVTLRFGQRDGRQSFSLDASLPLGGRTRLFARYAERLGSSALLAGDLLGGLRVDALGNLVDAATGVPAAISGGGSLLNSQSNLFRTRSATAAISQLWPVDTITLTLTREEREPAAVAAGTSAFAQNQNSAGLSWTRELDPGRTLTLAGQVGQVESATAGDGMRYGLRAILTQALSPTLFGSLQYRFTSRETNDGDAVQNSVLVSLRQLF